MTYDYLWEIQKTIFLALQNNEKILNAVKGIYSYVPQNTDFPYIRIREIYSSKISAIGKDINKVTLFIDVYSSNTTNKEVLNICSEVKIVLDKKIYPVEGYKMIGNFLQDEIVQQANDGVIWKGKMKFNIFIESNLDL